jgi:glycosyltransferase involved in cell wall biosynthesis
MKNILIIADIYPPEVSSAAHLMKELAEGLKKRGHNIWVITTYPRYYLPKELEDQKFELFSDESGIRVIRVKTPPLKKVNFIIRGIFQLLLPFLFFQQARKSIKGKLDVVIVYSPPLPLARIGIKIKKYFGAKFILNIQDIFPQNAVDLKILKNKLLIRFFEVIERNVYKSADLITFHSEGGRRFLIEKKSVPATKIVTLPNWIDLAPYQNLTKDISFRKQWNLQKKFIFLFAGIMGPAQELDFLIKIAKEFSSIKDIVFLLVGDGMEKEKIERMIRNYDLTNVIMKPFVSKDDYPYLAKEADVGLVCLSSKNKTAFVPGKILGYMTASKPLVAFLNQESDAFEVIREAKCGYAVKAGDLDKAVEIVRKIYNEKDKLKELGNNGFKYALNNFTIDVCLNKLEKLF